MAPGSPTAATLEVTTADDSEAAGDGLTSLREAITLAADSDGADRVVFAQSLSGATITTSSPVIINDKSLEIDASSLMQPVVLSGHDTHQILKNQGGTIVLRVRADGTLDPDPLPVGVADDFTHALTIPRDRATGLFRVRRN